MAMHLGQSHVILTTQTPHNVSITKKISNYIFNFDDKIGQGNFSKVYKGYHQFTNQLVAIKIVELSSVKSSKLQQLLFSEIEVIQSLNHPNILKCHQVLKSQHNCYIITELCNGGDLQSLLKKQKCFNQLSALTYIKDIFKGLLYLGERGIVHRDLKIANIFLHNGSCKIADFGFAKYTNNQNFLDLDIGSPLYMSPEGMIQHMYGMKTDIWAFGIILYQLLHGKTPFSYCTSQYELKRAVVSPISYHSLRSDLSNELKQLIIKCLIVNSNYRPDAITLKNDVFLQRLLSVNQNQRFLKHADHTHLEIVNSGLIDQFNKCHLSPHLIDHGIHVKSQHNLNTNPYLNQPHNLIVTQNTIPHQVSVPSIEYHEVKIIQLDTNSPHRGQIVRGSKASQDSQNKKETLKLPNNSLTRIDSSPNKSIQLPHSYQHIHTPTNYSTNLITYPNHPKNFVDKILVPEQHNYLHDSKQEVRSNSKNSSNHPLKNTTKQNTRSNDNLCTVNNSSWLLNNQNKKKLPKTLSHQNVNKIQNHLSPSLNNMSLIKNSQHNKQQTQKNQHQARIDEANKFLQNLSYLNSTKAVQIKVHQTSNNQTSQQDIQLNFKQDATRSPKKFGEIIKGEKKPTGNVKSTIKVQKNSQPQSNFLIERLKTKSQLQIDQVSIIDVSQESFSTKKRQPRHSHGNTPDSNHIEIPPLSQTNSTKRTQAPSFIQEKQRTKQQVKRNLISGIIQFKEAVGFLHYCRLYFRFISTLKNIQLFPEVKKHEFLYQFFRNSSQNIEFYSRFLLAALGQLVENIRRKQIIYDGENYKKKKIKEDKLKEVSEQYFKKYMQQLSSNLTPNFQITNNHINVASITFIKEHNQQFWEQLDRKCNFVVQISHKTNQVSESLLKQLRNLCYFSIRIIEANDILASCMHLKSYKLLSETMIENWLGQEFYGEEVYFHLKNEYFKKINDFIALQKSETNDTQTQNRSRVNNLALDI